MKRSVLFFFSASLLTAATSQTVLLTENFDAYPAGQDITTLNPTYFGVWPGSDGAPISTTQAHSGANSAAFIGATAAGGPGDVLLLLGDKTAGSHILSWWMYVPSGKGGYFNIQHTEDVTTPSFAAEVIFGDGGTISGMANNVAIAGTYSQDAWFQVNLFIDLDNVTASFLIGTTPIATWPFNTETDGAVGPNQLGAIDFYAYGGGAPTLGEYYIDDVSYVHVSTIGITENVAMDHFAVYPVPSSGHISIASELRADVAQWRIVDMSGREVMTSTALVLPGSTNTIDISALAHGTYSLDIGNGNMRERHLVVRN